MAAFTQLTNLKVTGELDVPEIRLTGVTGIAAITDADATAAAGSNPTAAEFKKTVDLCNSLKAQVNKIIGALT